MTLVIAVAGINLFAMMLGHVQHEVGWKSAREVFPDATTASLAEAACLGDVEGVKRAVAEGADPNRKGFEGVTPLLWALSCESIPGMAALLEARADPNLVDDAGSTILHYAATYHDSRLLEFLLASGADPNIVNQSGHGPLEAALTYRTENGSRRNFDILIDAGADPYLGHASGDSIVQVASYRNQYELMYGLLTKYPGDKERLLQLVQRGVIDPDSPEAEWRKRVIDYLERHPSSPAPSL